MEKLCKAYFKTVIRGDWLRKKAMPESRAGQSSGQKEQLFEATAHSALPNRIAFPARAGALGNEMCEPLQEKGIGPSPCRR